MSIDRNLFCPLNSLLRLRAVQIVACGVDALWLEF